MINFGSSSGGAVAQLGARLDGIEEVVGSNPIGSTNLILFNPIAKTSIWSQNMLPWDVAHEVGHLLFLP
jgi:hypothetical protein